MKVCYIIQRTRYERGDTSAKGFTVALLRSLLYFMRYGSRIHGSRRVTYVKRRRRRAAPFVMRGAKRASHAAYIYMQYTAAAAYAIVEPRSGGILKVSEGVAAMYMLCVAARFIMRTSTRCGESYHSEGMKTRMRVHSCRSRCHMALLSVWRALRRVAKRSCAETQSTHAGGTSKMPYVGAGSHAICSSSAYAAAVTICLRALKATSKEERYEREVAAGFRRCAASSYWRRSGASRRCAAHVMLQQHITLTHHATALCALRRYARHNQETPRHCLASAAIMR